MNILIVDDIAWNRDLLVGFFAGTHHRTSVAQSGLQALALARTEPPDLVLMDIRMPDMDGRELLRQMRMDPFLKHLPVIAVTAASPGSGDEDLRRVFNGYLRKPLAKLELLQELQSVLGSVALEAPATTTAPTPSVNSDLSAAERLSAQERLHLLTVEVWPRLRDTVAMRESRAFAQELQQLGQALNDATLGNYARRLGEAVDRFEITTVESTLRQFPDHVASSLIDTQRKIVP